MPSGCAMAGAHCAQTAFRGYGVCAGAHAHDFTLPEDITRWYPHPSNLQSAREYLACAGLDRESAAAKREDDPTAVKPVSRLAFRAKGHDYLEVLTSANTGQIPCPECVRGHVRAGVNDLATIAPRLASELHPTLNGQLEADGIAASSNKRVWWVCPVIHPFCATPANRTLNDSGCGVCLGRVVLAGINDLWTTHTQLAVLPRGP